MRTPRILFLLFTTTLFLAGCAPTHTIEEDTISTTLSEGELQNLWDLQTIYLPPKSLGLPYILLWDQWASGMEIGCGDSVVLETAQVPSTITSEETLIKRAYTQVFNQAWLQDNQDSFLPAEWFAVNTVRIENKAIELSFIGELILAGVCDNPRVIAQLVSIPAQLWYEDVQVFINDETLESYLGMWPWA